MQRIRIVSIFAKSTMNRFWDVYPLLHKQVGVYVGEDSYASCYDTELSIQDISKIIGEDILYDLKSNMLIVQD